ncbi:hypothetical protein [Nodularia sp. NIES-3585]|uniref:hypothetical protein n=1 Tax=Nodularia sp. NIES-3585 TaxID=1973477 RepID=UPI000B5CF645|nr:hypothetical protein [Nodularia sp. NIES-3585]GAX35587.1 hypothetical protein NIES3585_16040 [Nodularia sp. NIES-3585]
MHKLIPTIALIVSSILITSCGNSPTDTVKETTTNTIEITQTDSQLEDATVSSNETKPSSVDNSSKPPKTEVVSTTPRNPKTQLIANNQPQVGTVKELVTGDIICYATIVDEQGKEHRVGASFEICAESEKYLNKKVRASYKIASLNDCESIEPCGKSRQESIISQMQILGESPTKPQASNSSTFSNGKWTITIGNRNSWSGVNNTGNLTYKGCDAKGNCIDLTGGKVNCRDGKCVMGWVTGNYRYIWSQVITEDGNASPTLIVKQGDREILNATGFKLVPSS